MRVFLAGLFLCLLLLRLFSGPVFDPKREVAGIQIGRVPSSSVWTHSESPRTALANVWSGDEHGPVFLPIFEWLVIDGLWLSGLMVILSVSALGGSRLGRRLLASLLGLSMMAAGLGWIRRLLLVEYDDFTQELHFLGPAFLPVVPSTSLSEGESTAHLWECPLFLLRGLDILSLHRLAATIFGLWIIWILVRPPEKTGRSLFGSRQNGL
jgi:hypothetical protein